MNVRFLVCQHRMSVNMRAWAVTTLMLCLAGIIPEQASCANQPPVFVPQADTAINQFQGLSFTVRASDFESTPTLSSSGLPTGALFLPLINGTGTFTWSFLSVTPPGIYRVYFYATDDSSVVDTMAVRIFVLSTSANDLPFLDSTGAKNGLEGNNLAFSVSAFDGESTPALSIDSLPTGANFVDNNDGTGQFSWTPSYVQSGIYTIRIKATDDSGAVVSELVQITITEAGNQLPVLSAIGNKSTTENVSVIFQISATDPEGMIPVLTTTTLPTGAVFVDSGNGVGLFSWLPGFTQSGIYPIRFTASDGQAVDTETITITVNDAGNQPPVLGAIGNKNVTENSMLSFAVTASDPDGTAPSLNTSTLPIGASFTDNGNGSASFSWTPGFTQAGSYVIRFRATDGIVVDSEVVTISVAEAGNQPPVLTTIGAKAVSENVLLSFIVSATDPDSSTPILSTSSLPTGATFVDSGNGKGNFRWTPTYTQAGNYIVTFSTFDGTATDSESITITVNEAGNQTPVLAAIGNKVIGENATLSFVVSATDPDATTPALYVSTLPSGAVFVDSGNGKGSFIWTPDFSQAGTFPLLFRATDGVAADSESITITVTEAGNQPPVLASIGDKTITEGNLLTFSVSAIDADGTYPVLTLSGLAAGIPAGATFSGSANGTGTFNWTPSFVQSGNFSVQFAASDGFAGDSESISITVVEAGNQPPSLDPISPQIISEGEIFTLVLFASDPEGVPAITLSPLPTGAAFVDSGNGSALFTWTPAFTDSGNYSATLTATDDSGVVASTVLAITVADSSLASGLASSFSNYPNPFTSDDEFTTLTYFLNETGNVDLEIFTLTGERVIAIAQNAPRSVGPSIVDQWDGHNGTGRRVVPGTYICQLTVRYDSGRTESVRRKVALLN